MVEPWDDSLKTFINENPQDFVSWLLGDAQFKKNCKLNLRHGQSELMAYWKRCSMARICYCRSSFNQPMIQLSASVSWSTVLRQSVHINYLLIRA